MYFYTRQLIFYIIIYGHVGLLQEIVIEGVADGEYSIVNEKDQQKNNNRLMNKTTRNRINATESFSNVSFI